MNDVKQTRRAVVIPQVHQALTRPEIEERFVDAVWRLTKGTALTLTERERECRACLSEFREMVRP